MSETNDVPPSPPPKDKESTESPPPTVVTPSKNAEGCEHTWTHFHQHSQENVQEAATPQGHLEPTGRSWTHSHQPQDHLEPTGQSAPSIIDADKKRCISANSALPSAECPLPTVVTPNSRSKNAEGREHTWNHIHNTVQDAATPQRHLEPAGRSALSIGIIDADNKEPLNITISISIETTVRSDPDAKWPVGSPSNGSESAYALRYSTT